MEESVNQEGASLSEKVGLIGRMGLLYFRLVLQDMRLARLKRSTRKMRRQLDEMQADIEAGRW